MGVLNPTFSLIVPTRQRTALLRRLLDSIKATTTNPDAIEIVLVIDADDEESIQFGYDGIAIRKVQVPPGLTMGALNMSGYRAASGRYLMLLNDDVILRTAGWDEQVLDAFRSVPDGMVLAHVNDLVFQETLCIFPFLSREFCAIAGGICQENYRRYRIDDHIHNIFDLVSLLGHNRRIYLPEVVFEHTNVETSDGGTAHYVPDPAIHEIDTRLFDSLLDERRKIALEVVSRIHGHRNSEQQSTWRKKLDSVTDSVAIRRPEHARWFPATLPGRKTPRVTVGVVSGDSKSRHARKCLELLKACTANYDLILIDNNGDRDFNHSREMNRILSICRTDYLVLMDDDVFVQPGWLEGLLRCVGPETGVVTPLHLDKQSELSYAGVVLCPDETGHHTHILEKPAQPLRIQTLCSAVLLIDMLKCGHIRLDERYSKYFLDIDYGLRVWEEGFQVICSPYSTVTHVGGATMQQGGAAAIPLLEEQRRRYLASWVDTGRLSALRHGVWKTIPDIQWIDDQAAEIERLLDDCQNEHRDAQAAAQLLRGLTAYPALQDYLPSRAFSLIRNAPELTGPKKQSLISLVETHGKARDFERDFRGMNIIVLPDFTYYALPQGDAVLSYRRIISKGYSYSCEADTPEAVKEQVIRDQKTGKIPDGQSNEVHLLESIGDCNILSVGPRFAVVPQSLGAIDFRIPLDREKPGIVWTENLSEARETASKIAV
jgi:GT2 family glycosyltransferase